MKKFLSAAFAVLVFILFGTSNLLAQAPAPALGDFGSAVSGDWSSPATWKLWSTNNAFDSTTTGTPSSSHAVFILTGTTVTYDYPGVSSANCKDLIIQSGATLQSNQTLPGGTLNALKVNGSTIWVDGNLGKDSTDAFLIETKYDGTITLAGSGTINIGQLRPNSSQKGTLKFVFAANTKINFAGSDGKGGAGIYTTRGKQSSATFSIQSGVTLTFAANSNFQINSNSGLAGAMNTNLNIDGTLNMPYSNFIFADSAGYNDTVDVGSSGKLNIGGSLIPFVSTVNNDAIAAVINVDNGGEINILKGGTADFTNADSKVTGGGTFSLNAGGNINVGASAGLNTSSGPVQTTTANFDTAANYNYVGTGLQYLGAQLPDVLNNLTIGKNSVDSLTTAKKINGELLINGTLINTGGITSNGTAVVNGTYQHNNTGKIPNATWNTGSTCLFTAPTTGSSGYGNGDQTFYNVKVNFPNCLGAARLGIDGATINGDLTIHNTNDPAGSANNYVALFTKKGTAPVTVMGNLNIDSSAADMSIGTGSGNYNQSLIVHGNVTSNGVLYLNGSGVQNTLKVFGNLTINNTVGNSFRGHSNSDWPDSVIFAGNGIQTLIKPTGLTNLDNLRFRVLSGSTLLLNDTTVVTISGSSPGSFTLDPGATLICGNHKGLNGSLTGLAPELSIGANYEFNGSSAQPTGSLMPDTVKNLNFNNAFADTLSKGVTVTGEALIKSGASVVESSGKYIIGTATTTQTVGTGANSNIGGLGVGINSGTDNLGDVTISRIAGSSGVITVGGMVSINRNWTISQSGSAPAAGRDLTLTWDSGDNNGLNMTKAVVWKNDGSSWSSATNLSGTDASGSGGIQSITVNGVTSFSKWTVSDDANPLPVELSSFSGIAGKDGVELKWTTASELNNLGWDVERASSQLVGTTPRQDWITIGSVKGSGTSTTLNQYSFLDKEALNGSFQYRLKQKDIDGTFKYSNTVEVKNNVVLSYKLGNYPNPFNPSTKIAFEIPVSGMVNITVYNMLGQKVATIVNQRMESGDHEIIFNATGLASGMYIYRLTAGSNVMVKKMLLLK